MPNADGSRSGGRKAGTPNKATGELKKFLNRVFLRAFEGKARVRRPHPDTGELVWVELSLEDQYVEAILNGTVDAKLLATLLAYWAGRPTQQIQHGGVVKVSLEQLITGNIPADTDEDDE